MSRVSHYMVRDRWTTRAGEWVLFALARGFRWVTWPVPTWALTGAVAWAGSRLVMVIPAFRRRAEENLARIWPEMPVPERRGLVRQAAGQFLRLAVEYARLDRVAREMVLEVDGLAHLDAARAAGKGAVLVGAHYGNWEAGRVAAKRAGHEVGIIYRAFNNRYLDRFTMNLIPVAGEPVLQKGREGMRALVGHVRRGGMILILVDQRNSGAPFLDFLGQPAETVTAAADLAARTGAALIPMRAARNVAARRFDVTFEAPIPADAPGGAMQAVNDRIAAWVREDPAQWFWFHRRWRSTVRSRARPEGE